MRELADFLEQLARSDAWTSEFDRALARVEQERTRDDWLQDAAVEAADVYHLTLTADLSARQSKAKQVPGLHQQREELRAIARDLRLAAGLP